MDNRGNWQDTFDYFSNTKLIMMRALILALVLAIGTTSFSQDCKEIKMKDDEFENSKTYYTPYYDPQTLQRATVSVSKFIQNKKVEYWLYLSAAGTTPIAREHGAYVLFTDATKLSWPSAAIDTEVENGAYVYSAYIKITVSQLKILRTKSVKKVKLYLFQEDVYDMEVSKLHEYLDCLIDLK